MQALADLDYIRKQPLWKQLSPEDKLRVLELGSCNLGNKEAAGQCSSKWLSRRLYGVVLDPRKVVAAISAALHRLEARQQALS
jgi:hypothetical protein